MSDCTGAGVTRARLGQCRCLAPEDRYVPRCQPCHQGHLFVKVSSLKRAQTCRGLSNGQAGGQTWCFQVSFHDIRRVPFPH